MKLYYAETLMPRKPCALAKHLKSSVEYAYVDLGKGEHRGDAYKAVNPNRKVPALVDGELKLWESNAIMCHLAAKAGSDLWPGDPARQVEAIRWLSWDQGHFTRYLGVPYVQYVIKPHYGLGDPDLKAVEEALGPWRKSAAILEEHLGGRTWLTGDHLSVADFALAVTLPWAEAAHIPLDEFPAIQRWHDRLNELEAWREPWPAMAHA
jgi:glutathione S-transferase